jgi:3-oxoacyl-[acyl-carrier protein] reductase
MPLKDRVAFVTGASQGIGRACGLELAKAGARVVAAARQLDKLSELAGEIRSVGGEAAAVELDLRSPESIKAAVAQAREVYGGIDILVNNAGITRDGLAMRMSAAHWSEVLETNLTGSFQVIQAVLPGMVKNRWGRIINISSVVGLTGNPGQANYVASKSGLIGLTKALAQEVGSRNITVNAVAPGFIDTAMTQALDQKVRDKILAAIPLGRMGSAEEIAHAVAFLAGDQASYITGHVLNVNGGMYM